MHNGILSGYGNNLTYGMSDTTNFKDKILVPLLTRNPNALDDEDIWKELNRMTSGSRLIFLDSNGVVKRTSESSWNNRYGLTLSNTYMLPSEPSSYQSSNVGGRSNVVAFQGGQTTPKPTKEGYPLYRKVLPQGGGVPWSCWFREVIPGIIRSEYGTLYYDHGPNNILSWAQDYIKADDEISALTAMSEHNRTKGLPVYRPSVDDLLGNDDDLPWSEEDMSPPKQVSSKSTVATEEEKLRYARVVHNCHDGNAVSRVNLIADLLCMGAKELAGFIKEDPENAETVVAELLEIVIDQNDMLREDPTCEDYTWDYDELTELGSGEHHQQSMKMISDARKKHYADLAAAAAEMEEAKRKEREDQAKQSVKDKSKKNKKQRKAA